MTKNKSSVSFLAHARNRILAGLFVIVPLAITIWVAWFVYSQLTEWAVDLLLPYLPDLEENFWVSQGIRIATLLTIASILFVIGELARYKLGRWFIRLTEWAVLKLPILRTVYTTCHQIGEAIWAPSGNMFRKVVLFEYPRKGIYVIGFLTNDNHEGNEITNCTGKKLLSIFLPTTPNPTSGFLLFVPNEDCTILDMKISDAMRLIISGGAINAKDIQAEKQLGATPHEETSVEA
ncbi:MAG: DUF502 domain-containing protein [Victivallaceae bacterium]|nr:DUF502 domain-containing protein [Victivallaceae bacterium]